MHGLIRRLSTPGEAGKVERYVLKKPYLHAFTIHDLRRELDKTNVYIYYLEGGVAGYALIYCQPGAPASVIVDGESMEIVESLIKTLRARESLPKATFHLDARYEEAVLRYYTPLTVYRSYCMFTSREWLRKPPTSVKVDFIEVNQLGNLQASRFVEERVKNLKKAYGILTDNKLVAFGGFYVLEPEVAMIGSIWVEPSYRGRGFGKAIAWYVTAKALETSKYACLWVRKGNTPAIKAYKAIGYKTAREEAWINVGIDVAP